MPESCTRLKDGDEEEWESAYKTLKGPICGKIRKMVGNHAIAEELAQEVFFRLWNSRVRLDEQRGSMKDWSLRIARNCALDYLRSPVWRSASQSMAFERAELLRYFVRPGEETLYAQRGQLESILLHAHGLHAGQRTALLLAYHYGFSHAEIAKRMNAPLGTVKSWIRNALRTLRETSAAA